LGKYVDCITAIKTGIGIAERYRYSGFDMIVRLLVIASGTTRQRVIEHVKYLQDKVEQYKHMQFPFGEAVMLSNIAHMYYNIKFYSNYQNHVDQELAIINQWSFTERAIIRYQQLGLYNLGIRTDPRKAFEYFALSKRLTQSVTDDQSFLNSYHTTGFAQYYQFKGELQLAIQQYMQSVLSPESSAHFKILARSHSGIAVNLTNQGNFDKAYERLRKATDYFYPIRHANYDSWVGSLLQLAILQTKTHRSEEAKETLESVIRFSSDSSQSVDRMIPIRARLELFKLNCIDPLIGEYDKEEGYRHLEDYYLSNTDLSPVKHYLKLIKAIKSKNMPRLENKIEGLRLYRELALDAELAHDLRVEIYLALIEILGMEYKISNEDEVRQEIIKRLDQLYGMGVGVNFYIMVHYFVLNAKIEQADRNFKGADGLLQSAQDMCEKYNLSHLLEIVKEERVELNELLALWDDSLHSNQTLLAKIKQNNLDEYIKKMLSLT
ncbi:MAG: tetratricopeptide repeat protein, partial [Candidatus Kariarchaeaceae archaeon]